MTIDSAWVYCRTRFQVDSDAEETRPKSEVAFVDREVSRKRSSIETPVRADDTPGRRVSKGSLKSQSSERRLVSLSRVTTFAYIRTSTNEQNSALHATRSRPRALPRSTSMQTKASPAHSPTGLGSTRCLIDLTTVTRWWCGNSIASAATRVTCSSSSRP